MVALIFKIFGDGTFICLLLIEIVHLSSRHIITGVLRPSVPLKFGCFFKDFCKPNHQTRFWGKEWKSMCINVKIGEVYRRPRSSRIPRHRDYQISAIVGILHRMRMARRLHCGALEPCQPPTARRVLICLFKLPGRHLAQPLFIVRL